MRHRLRENLQGYEDTARLLNAAARAVATSLCDVGWDGNLRGWRFPRRGEARRTLEILFIKSKRNLNVAYCKTPIRTRVASWR